MSTVATGTMVAQLVNISGLLVATRLLSPADFGAFGLHLAVSTPLAILATGRYEVAFIAADGRSVVSNLFALSVVSALIVVSTFGIFLAAIGGVSDALDLSVSAIIVLAIGQAWMNCTTQLNNYNRGYGVIAVSRVGGAIVTQAVMLSLAITPGTRSLALIIGMAAGMFVSVVISIAGNADWLRFSLGSIRLRRIFAVARKHSSFLFYNGPQAIASALQESAAVWAITASFGQSATGLYVLANRLLRGPIALVAESVGRVLQRQVRDIADLRKRAFFIRRCIVILVTVALLFCALALGLAEPVFDSLMPTEWTELGPLARSAAPFYAAYLVASSIAAIPLATGDHRSIAVLAIVGSTLYPATLFVSGLYTDSLPAAFSIVSAVMGLYFCAFVLTVYRVTVARRMRV